MGPEVATAAVPWPCKAALRPRQGPAPRRSLGCGAQEDAVTTQDRGLDGRGPMPQPAEGAA